VAAYAWVGRILRVDLTERRITEEETMRYGEKYIGGRGVAARVAWEEMPPGIDAFSPENRLLFMTGPLTGTMAPTAGGRIEVCGVAPQAYPTPRYTRSSMGGHWGPELKYAGYDGVIIQGRAEEPTYLWVQDGEAEIRDASRLWGLDTFATQKAILREQGKTVKVVCIGQAGERLVRFAVIQSGVESAAGQGGFGAVMGSKNLKAIAVRGTGGVRVARPDQFLDVCEHVRQVIHGPMPEDRPGFSPENKSSCLACSARCLVFRRVEDEVVALHCCSGAYPTLKPEEAGLKAALLADKYGLNHWEIVHGFGGSVGGWLNKCKSAGVLTEDDIGIPLEPESGEFLCEMLRRVAYREGIGDIFAEGLARAADILGKGRELLPHVAHGYQTHWDGHIYGAPRFPYWLVSALTWALDSRDPMVHGYASQITSWWAWGKGPLTIEQVKRIYGKVTGCERAVDPEGGYEHRAQPTIWHQNRDAVKDSLQVCDIFFPLFFSRYSEDGYGDTAAEANLFSAATGVEMTEAELDMMGERIFNLERAIMAREGRTRAYDEASTDYFKKPDHEGVKMDETRFRALMDEYYDLRGWDRVTGWPTRAKLEQLGLRDVADQLDRLP